MSVIIISDETSVFSSFEEMFQKISEKGSIIDFVKDGVISINGKESQFLITSDAPASEFKAEIEVYKDKLRANIVALKSQGISISKDELDKLAKQFDFLKPTPVKAEK